MPLDEYVILSRIIGIVMDNALEASIKSKEKFVMIEVFEQNDNVIIIMINASRDSSERERESKKTRSLWTFRCFCLFVCEEAEKDK